MHRTDAIQSAAPDTAVAIETSTLGLHTFEQYAPLIGAAASERIFSKAEALRTLHVVHISSMNTMGIETGWRMIQGTPAFFVCTNKLHNALRAPLSSSPKREYRRLLRLRRQIDLALS
jgi:trehalose synthase